LGDLKKLTPKPKTCAPARKLSRQKKENKETTKTRVLGKCQELVLSWGDREGQKELDQKATF